MFGKARIQELEQMLTDTEQAFEAAEREAIRYHGLYYHLLDEIRNANRGIHNLRRKLERARWEREVLQEGWYVSRAVEDHLKSQGVDVLAAYVHVINHPELVEGAKQEQARLKREAYESSKREPEPVG